MGLASAGTTTSWARSAKWLKEKGITWRKNHRSGTPRASCGNRTLSSPSSLTSKFIGVLVNEECGDDVDEMYEYSSESYQVNDSEGCSDSDNGSKKSSFPITKNIHVETAKHSVIQQSAEAEKAFDESTNLHQIDLVAERPLIHVQEGTFLSKALGTSLPKFNKELILMASDSSPVRKNALKVQPRRSGKSKRQACMYCNILCTQLPRYLKRKYSNEYDVALAESLTDKQKKGCVGKIADSREF